MKKKWERKKLYKIMKKQSNQMIVMETEEMTGFFIMKEMPSEDELALLKNRLKEVLSTFMNRQQVIKEENSETKGSLQDSMIESQMEEKNAECNFLMEEQNKQTENEAEMIQLQRQNCGGFIIKEIHLERGYTEKIENIQENGLQASEHQTGYQSVKRNCRRGW